MEFLDVQNIRKSFGDTNVLNGISFTLAEHQTLAILGRSGCGKTTLLKIIAGLQKGEGEVVLKGKTVSTLPPQEREAVYLYQESLLFPHLDIWENVAFGLKLRKLPPQEIKNRTEAMLVGLDLTAQARKMPQTLSGGQKQRVSFGRALIIRPSLMLLDEPFGALDAETRTQMQQLYRQMAAEHRITAVFVTHDLKEAILMGNKLGFMEQGRLHIYDELNEFSADVRTGMQQEIDFWKQRF